MGHLDGPVVAAEPLAGPFHQISTPTPARSATHMAGSSCRLAARAERGLCVGDCNQPAGVELEEVDPSRVLQTECVGT